jgi:hypothetical protein
VSCVEAGAVRKLGQRIDVGLALALLHALIALEGDCTEVHTGIDGVPLLNARSPFFPIIEGKGADHLAPSVADWA